MDVQNGARTPDGVNNGGCTPPGLSAGLCGEQVGVALGAWQAAELRLARSFGECRDLTREQLEDLYQETALVLLGRSFHSEEHLRHALRWGIKHRALHHHRDERRRGEILNQRGPELALAAERREAHRAPELAALLEDDRLIVTEFLTELTALERHVFWLMAEGMRYRAIAPLLAVSVNEARKAARACEAKRERFQLLYDTGRLCGFRSQTILAMQGGEAVDHELARRAYAHLEGCAHCREQHKTNARRLRSSFQGQAAALLPIPVLTGHLGWLTKLAIRVRVVQGRLAPHGPPPVGGGVREGAIAALASGGAAVKLAAAGASVAVLAGSAIGATQAVQHHKHHSHPRAIASQSARTTPPLPVSGAGEGEQARQYTEPEGAAQSERHPAHSDDPVRHHEPSGFDYLGVPTRSARATSGQARASTASAERSAGVSTTTSTGAGAGSGSEQRGGGPFGP